MSKQGNFAIAKRNESIKILPLQTPLALNPWIQICWI